MEIVTHSGNWLLLTVVGLIAGFIDAVVGGGGLLSIPALLTIGMPPHLALGTNKLAASFGSSMAAYTYYRQHLLQPKLWRSCFVATAIGALCGSILVYMVDTSWLEKLLPLLIIIMALYSLLSKKALEDRPAHNDEHPKRSHKIVQGLVLGGYDGFAGPGIGAIWIVSSKALHKLSFLKSCALSRAMTFASNTTALTVFLLLGKVDLAIGLLLGLSMMLGSFIGAHSAIRFGLPFIRPLFIIVVMAIALHLTWSAWL
ncbi:sulfite exporter TauE/SafE family protein [Shewanella dokdonensis]|uniref:Probable membrane transporter protein n=1 Tax=Shewanella dokdonensis TaxID=712036 RepID=A0ABX8DDR1_9GAMM|nr:TSUP family transporter [Shewanella dokdonensis]MCL1073304.1 TSUP family transporter [Shewanella dokdonensis]QVK22864.1 TSUP family transporter [Shewanella dokdonensis]